MKANPYVGPRPFERGDRYNFYGRDREARELRALVVAEREVLFYAQSGAGKTSLLNAQVIPALEDKGFHVLPLARVGSELPPEIDPRAVDNVFAFSALLTLSGQDVDPQTLLNHTLDSFLQTPFPQLQALSEARPPVLIFDQFEELFTSHRHRWQEAEGFFRQVRAALDALPKLGVVLAMREDHVAQVDPYAPLLPRRLRARFRMERLGPAGALAAVKRPAEGAGCPFAPGVAERLVDDLRRTKVQHYPGAGPKDSVKGPFVEPVQLQVVCNRLWANLPEQKDSAIQWAEVQQHGDVDRALTDFYESALSLTARQTQVEERELRRWFGGQLITPMGTRGLALRRPDQTAGLPNPAVDALQAQHLIRAEVRAGARWYELAHDRLVEPIRESNQAWEAARETPLRAAARRWQQTGDADLLYRGDALDRAQTWAEAHPDQVEAYEVTFLEASQQAKQERDRRRRLRTSAIIGLVLGLALMVVVTVLLYRGEQRARQAEARAQEQQGTAVAEAATAKAAQNTAQVAKKAAQEQQGTAMAEAATAEAAEGTAEARRQEAEDAKAQAEAQRQIALARQLAAQAQLAPDGTGAGATRGLLLAVESLRHAHTLEGDQALRQGLAQLPRLITQMKQENSVEALAFSPDGRHLASAGGRWERSGEAWVWDLETDQAIAHFELSDVVLALAFSPDGQWLAAGSADGTAQVWDLSTGQEIAQIKLDGSVDTLAFSAGCASAEPCNHWLVAGSTIASGILSLPREVRVWDVATDQTVAHLEYTDDAWNDVSNPDGRWLVLPYSAVRDTATGQEIPLSKCCFGFDLEGSWAASGYQDGGIEVWDVTTNSEPERLQHDGPLSRLAFSPDARWLASADEYGTVKVWDMNSYQPVAWMAQEQSIYALAFSPDGRQLAAGSQDGTTTVWETLPVQERMRLDDGATVLDVTYSPDGQRIASASWEGDIYLWQASTGNQLARMERQTAVRNVLFSPDGRWLAAKEVGEAIIVWQTNPIQEVCQIQPDDLVFAGTNLAFSPDGHWLASTSADNVAQVWETATCQPVAHVAHEDDVGAVAFSPDGQWLASGSGRWDRGQVRLWQADTGQEIARMDQDLPVQALAFSPDGQWLAAGSGDPGSPSTDVGQVQVWEAGTGREIARLSHEGPVTLITFSPDGDLIASVSLVSGVSGYGQLHIWEASTGQKIAHMTHERPVDSVQFSPDGQWLVSSDGQIHVWRTADGQEVAQMPQAQAQATIRSAVFSPDGRWIASGDENATVRVWWWRPADLIVEACTRLSRNFTSQEKTYFLGDEAYTPPCPNLVESER